MTRENRPGRRWPTWKLIVMQLLLTGLVLCVFALFHHVIPDIRLRMNGIPEPVGTVERQPAASPTPASLPEETPNQEAESPETTEPTPPVETPEPTPESWSVRFSDHFSQTVEQDEFSYRSPDVSVTVTKYSHPEDYPNLTFFAADIYLTDIAQFRTGFPREGTFDSGESIAKTNAAVLAINGDSMLTQRDGFLVRNGEIYKEKENSGDLCVLYYDGSMEIYGPGEYTRQEILDREPYQIWQFGPSLLDKDGQPLESFNISSVLQSTHPRTALGYYEPGHYCFVVVDGRQGEYSYGADIATLARIMSDLGCVSAYNLDGGASSMMIFNGKRINRQSADRYINDMLIITEAVEGEEGSR